jgi:hypothetical protein
MERGKDGNYRVSRDEARAFKLAASLMCRLDLVETYAHYLGVRQSSRFTQQRVRLENGMPKDSFQEELINLPVLVEHSEVAVNGLNYVYTPHLAEESIRTLRAAMNSGHLLLEEQAKAEQLSTDYDELHRHRIVA